MSTWTSGHINEPKKKKNKVWMCIKRRACSDRKRDDGGRRNEKGDAVHIVGLKYLEKNLSEASFVAEYNEGPGV